MIEPPQPSAVEDTAESSKASAAATEGAAIVETDKEVEDEQADDPADAADEAVEDNAEGEGIADVTNEEEEKRENGEADEATADAPLEDAPDTNVVVEEEAATEDGSVPAMDGTDGDNTEEVPSAEDHEDEANAEGPPSNVALTSST